MPTAASIERYWRLDRKHWAARIDEMIAKGAKLSDENIDVVAE
jgi:hypothetical protein